MTLLDLFAIIIIKVFVHVDKQFKKFYFEYFFTHFNINSFIYAILNN